MPRRALGARDRGIPLGSGPMAPLRRKKNRKPQIIPFQSKEGDKNVLEGLNKNPMMLVVMGGMKASRLPLALTRPTACKKKFKKRRKRECIRKREKRRG